MSPGQRWIQGRAPIFLRFFHFTHSAHFSFHISNPKLFNFSFLHFTHFSRHTVGAPSRQRRVKIAISTFTRRVVLQLSTSCLICPVSTPEVMLLEVRTPRVRVCVCVGLCMCTFVRVLCACVANLGSVKSRVIKRLGGFTTHSFSTFAQIPRICVEISCPSLDIPWHRRHPQSGQLVRTKLCNKKQCSRQLQCEVPCR